MIYVAMAHAGILARGLEEHYRPGDRFARTIYNPAMNSHGCAAERMATPEPVLSATILTGHRFPGKGARQARRR